MKPRWKVGALVLSVALALAACAGNPRALSTGSPVAAPTGAGAPTQPVPAATATAEMATPTVEPKPTATPGADLTLEIRDMNFGGLKSYRLIWTADWETTKDGKNERTNWEWRQEYTADLPALHSTWKETDAGGELQRGLEEWATWHPSGQSSVVKVDQAGKTSCMALYNVIFDHPEYWVPDGFFTPDKLGLVLGAKYAGADTVNGIPVRHYTYDGKAVGLPELTGFSGDIWVDAEGIRVVKDTARWEGGAGPLKALGASGESGKGSWTWELTDANDAITISPPSFCVSATDRLPVISGAYNKTTTPDTMIYFTRAKPEKVVAFYQSSMADAGWKQSGEPASADGSTTLEFAEAGQKVSVTVTQMGATYNQVTVRITKE